jgi:peptidyl-prolyl cis-trans isomerase A (cyclophilin A)
VTVPDPQVTLGIGNGSSSLGNVVITLTPNQTPITVNNFLDYVRSGFYVGTVFHRNSPGFVIQGGGYAAPLAPTDSAPTVKTPNATIVLEDNAGLSNVQWTVAMARTNAPNSATSQFFVNLVDNLFLDRTATARGYAVFGTVTAGTEVVTAMTAAPCVPYAALLPSGDCLPQPNLIITSAAQTR